MRRKIAAALLCLAAPALAQAPAKKPPAPNPVAASYAALPEADRIAIQTDLIWTGDYNGVASAEFAERSIAAVKAFQKRLGHKDTGVLNPPERQTLADAARRKREAVGWRIVDDAATGARLGLPTRLVPNAARAAAGSRWASSRNETSVETLRAPAGATLQSVYDEQRALSNRKVTYGVLRNDFFVVAGLQELQKFYVRGQLKDGVVRGVTIRYDQALEGTMDPIVIAMSSAFANLPSLGPPPRPKVEYGTAVIAAPSGYLVTAAHLLDGCEIITVVGTGPADVVAADKESGLALLRVYGARDLRAARLASRLASADVTIAGVADPQAQGGGGAVEAKAARIRDPGAGKSAIDATLPAGFAGAGVYDAQGGLAGVVVGQDGGAQPHAEIAGAASLAKFLAAHKLSPAGDAAADASASVRRLICVRK